MEFPYTVVTDYQNVPEVLQRLDAVPLFALDLETTGLDYNRSVIHGISVATADHAWYLCSGAERAMLPHLNELGKTKKIVGHNLKFDLHFLNRYGIRFPNMIDTMIGWWLANDSTDRESIGLKKLAQSRLGIREELPDFKELLHAAKKLLGKKRLDEVSIWDMPLDKLAEYAARDARITFDLWPVTEHELAKQGMERLFWEVEMPFVQVLMDMEATGFLIDQKRLATLEVELGGYKAEALARWQSIAGDVNPNSPAQIATYLYDVLGHTVTKKTKSETPSTEVLALTRMLPNDKNGAVKALLDYRNFDKLMQTYVISFREKLYNGRLHGTFNQAGTRSSRLSSSDPNLQNIPSHGEKGSQIRELFIAGPGNVFLDIDYSQLELRIAAHYTKDPNLMRVFLEGLDPHQMTADGIGAERYVGKTINFSWFYGAGPFKIADTIEKSGKPRPELADCKRWLNKFGETYPGAARWKKRVIEYAREVGYVRTIDGHRRWLPNINSFDKQLCAEAERQAVNTIIQGSAADIVKRAMLNITKIQPMFDTKIATLSQVHDELCWETPKEAVKDFAQAASYEMTQVSKFFDMRVALEAKPGYGANWSEAKG